MRGTKFFGIGTVLTACVLALLLAGEAGLIAWAGNPHGGPPGQGKKPPKGEKLPWGVDRIDADMVWDPDGDLTVNPGTITGSGIKVAILDTGIDKNHPDLVANIKGGINTVGEEPAEAYDDLDDHGTGMGGVIAAVDNDQGIIGVGPDIELYAVRFRKARGIVYPDNYPNHGTTYNFTDLYEGMRWCIDNQMQVINFSFGIWTIKYDKSGTPQREYPLHDCEFYRLIKEAYNAGIVMVAAAGNGSRRIETYQNPDLYYDQVFEDLRYDFPASYPEVIAVSATGMRTWGKPSERGDYFASFSNYGPAIDLAAPGVSVLTTDKDGDYGTHSGTSLSAPHVVGVAALVLAKLGPLTPDEVRARLKSTAEWLDTLTAEQQGAGLVDAEAAVFDTPAAPPLRHTISSTGKLSVTWGELKGR